MCWWGGDWPLLLGVLEPSLPRAFQVGGDGSLVIGPHNGSSEVRSLCWFSGAYSRLPGGSFKVSLDWPLSLEG